MYITANTCTSCWQGSYVNAVCNHCHHKKTSEFERRSDALALMDNLNGRYTIGEVLGKGGFGITYSAWDNVENRRVALKELFPNKSVYRSEDRKTVVVSDDEDMYFSAVKEKFKAEAELLKLLGGDCGVVQLYDLFHCNNTVYYTMEYLEGCDLNAYRMKHGLLSWEFLEPIMNDLLVTLRTLHKQNLIHRDISPDNIFLTKDNKVRLIDFGSARTYQGVSNFTVQVKASFAPWEQSKSDGKQGPWTDIYALSVTMYLLLSGKLPPKVDDRIRGAKVKPLNELCPKLPQNVARAIEKGMNVEIRDRYLSVDEFMQALSFTVDIDKPQTVGQRVQPQQVVQQTVSRSQVFWLYGVSGVYAGKRKQLNKNQRVMFGRRSSNDIVFPEMTIGVSRSQCELFIDQAGQVYVRDAGSSYGTFLNNIRIGNEWGKVPLGSYLRFGNEMFQIISK